MYYDSYEPAKWESNGDSWIKTEIGKDCSDPDVAASLGNMLTTETQIKRIVRRRKQSNRMFTIGNSDLVKPINTEEQGSLLGDNYTVKGKNYPWGDKIDE